MQRIIAVVKRILVLLVIAVVIIASAYFGYKGIMWLSDWMNEIEARQRRSYPRI